MPITLGAFMLAATLTAQQTDNLPADPFRIAGNLLLVGSRDLGSYLITTDASDRHARLSGYRHGLP
jgi:hypothetical protein